MKPAKSAFLSLFLNFTDLIFVWIPRTLEGQEGISSRLLRFYQNKSIGISR